MQIVGPVGKTPWMAQHAPPYFKVYSIYSSLNGCGISGEPGILKTRKCPDIPVVAALVGIDELLDSCRCEELAAAEDRKRNNGITELRGLYVCESEPPFSTPMPHHNFTTVNPVNKKSLQTRNQGLASLIFLRPASRLHKIS